MYSKYFINPCVARCFSLSILACPIKSWIPSLWTFLCIASGNPENFKVHQWETLWYPHCSYRFLSIHIHCNKYWSWWFPIPFKFSFEFFNFLGIIDDFKVPDSWRRTVKTFDWVSWTTFSISLFWDFQVSSSSILPLHSMLSYWRASTMQLVSSFTYPCPVSDDRILTGVNGFDVVDFVKSVFFDVIGTSDCDICLTSFKYFGVIKLDVLVSTRSHIESLSLEVFRCSSGVTRVWIFKTCHFLTGVGVSSVWRFKVWWIVAFAGVITLHDLIGVSTLADIHVHGCSRLVDVPLDYVPVPSFAGDTYLLFRYSEYLFRCLFQFRFNTWWSNQSCSLLTVESVLLNSKTTQRSDAIFIIQINIEKKKLIYNYTWLTWSCLRYYKTWLMSGLGYWKMWSLEVMSPHLTSTTWSLRRINTEGTRTWLN